MTSSEYIDELIEHLHDWRGAMLADIRRIIRDADPEAVEELKWKGTPVWSHNGIVCLAKAFKDKVKLTFYNGARLPDPDRCFNSELEGRQWRAIDFHKGDRIREDSLRALVRSAVRLNEKGTPADADLP